MKYDKSLINRLYKEVKAYNMIEFNNLINTYKINRSDLLKELDACKNLCIQDALCGIVNYNHSEYSTKESDIAKVSSYLKKGFICINSYSSNKLINPSNSNFQKHNNLIIHIKSSGFKFIETFVSWEGDIELYLFVPLIEEIKEKKFLSLAKELSNKHKKVLYKVNSNSPKSVKITQNPKAIIKELKGINTNPLTFGCKCFLNNSARSMFSTKGYYIW